jgi:hypothetical protein
MKSFVLLFVLVLVSISGVYAQSIQFTDPFDGSTLDPWWNANVQQPGYITYPSSYLGVPCVQLDSVDDGLNYDVDLVHDFSGLTYGSASVTMFDSTANQASGDYIRLILGNSGTHGGDETSVTVFNWDYDYLFGSGDGGYDGGTYDYSAYDYTLGTGVGDTTGVNRTQAWHTFEIDDTASSLSVAVDGVVVPIGTSGIPFDSVSLDLGHWYPRPAVTTYFTNFSFNGSPAPEPSTIALLGIGAASLLAYCWRKRRAS